jgi:hypothetical protein
VEINSDLQNQEGIKTNGSSNIIKEEPLSKKGFLS